MLQSVLQAGYLYKIPSLYSFSLLCFALDRNTPEITILRLIYKVKSDEEQHLKQKIYKQP